MVDILTVCTGNICRSPLAALILQRQLAGVGAAVASAGTRGLDGAAMPTEAQRLAREAGVKSEDAAHHRSRFLTEQMLESPVLVLGMSREHRARVISLAPSLMRSSFTVREFARIAESMSPGDLQSIAGSFADAPRVRLARIVRHVGLVRNEFRAVNAIDDDVVDPYRQPWEVYLRSRDELVPAVDVVGRVVREAFGPAPHNVIQD